MRFFSLVFVNLRRHRLRALIGVAGIGFGVAAMLTILAIVTGAIGMFERILSSDSHYLVFERNDAGQTKFEPTLLRQLLLQRRTQ